MLSFGTELFLAFWMASKSVGLPAGSPPPLRAATSTFLISLANVLLRLASTTAFLCLVVAHLEWPLMDAPSAAFSGVPHVRRGPRVVLVRPPRELTDRGERPVAAADQVAEQAVHPPVTGQLGMERGSQHHPLPNRDDPTLGRPRPGA